MMELHLRLGPGQGAAPARTRWRRDACRPGPAPPRGIPQPPSRRRCARSRRVRSAHGGAGRRPDRARCRQCWTTDGRRSPRSAGGCRGRGRGTGPGRSPPPASPTASPSTMARCAAQISCSVRRAPPPRCQDGTEIGEILGFDEQLHEGRMRDVVGLRRQHHFGIGRHIDLARPVAGIGNRHAADLGVVSRPKQAPPAWWSAFRRAG